MNVSSVKNLNGETFSAVQDTFLTNIVSSNSANWNEISAYQANSGNFLTAHQSLEGYLQDSDLTIVDNKITEISGVPLSAGDEFPQSATDAIGYVTATSANIDSTIDNVSANSGVWGGSALPVSAGPGIKFEMVDGTLVFSNDSVVLYDNETGRPTTVGSQLQLSESPLNFEYIEVYLNGSSPTGNTNLANAYSKFTDEYITHVNTLMFNGDFIAASTYTQGMVWQMGCAYSGVSSTTWTKVYGYAHPITSFPSDWFTNNTHLNIYKIVGINRK